MGARRVVKMLLTSLIGAGQKLCNLDSDFQQHSVLTTLTTFYVIPRPFARKRGVILELERRRRKLSKGPL